MFTIIALVLAIAILIYKSQRAYFYNLVGFLKTISVKELWSEFKTGMPVVWYEVVEAVKSLGSPLITLGKWLLIITAIVWLPVAAILVATVLSETNRVYHV